MSENVSIQTQIMPTDMQGWLFRTSMGLYFTQLAEDTAQRQRLKKSADVGPSEEKQNKDVVKCRLISASQRKAELQNWSLGNSWCQVSCQCTVRAVLAKGIFFTMGIFHSANNLSTQIRRGYCSFFRRKGPRLVSLYILVHRK